MWCIDFTETENFATFALDVSNTVWNWIRPNIGEVFEAWDCFTRFVIDFHVCSHIIWPCMWFDSIGVRQGNSTLLRPKTTLVRLRLFWNGIIFGSRHIFGTGCWHMTALPLKGRVIYGQNYNDMYRRPSFTGALHSKTTQFLRNNSDLLEDYYY